MPSDPSNPKDVSETYFQPPAELVAQAQAAAIGSANHREHSNSSQSGSTTTNPSNTVHYDATGSRSIIPGVHETPIEHAPPPAYSETYGNVNLSQGGVDTRATVASRCLQSDELNLFIDKDIQMMVVLTSGSTVKHIDSPTFWSQLYEASCTCNTKKNRQYYHLVTFLRPWVDYQGKHLHLHSML